MTGDGRSSPSQLRSAPVEGTVVPRWVTWAAVGLVVSCVLAVGGVLIAGADEPAAPATHEPHGLPAATGPRAADASTPASATHRGALERLIRPAAPYLGISLPEGPRDLAAVDLLGRLAGHRPDLLEYFEPWTEPINLAWARATWAAGLLPLLTWEPWDPWDRGPDGNSRFDQPDYTLAMLSSGRYDAYIRTQALAVRDLHFPIALRFAHEMNGYWYPWGVATKGAGNTASAYVRAWRHVWQIFHDAGATNVVWVWSVNVVSGAPNVALSSVYPGDRYVDWVGLSGYLDNAVTTFDDEYANTLAQLRGFADDKPWLIAETGASASDPAVRAAEIDSLFAGIRDNPEFVGLVWFDHVTPKADWRFENHPATLDAFRRQVAAGGFGALPAPKPTATEQPTRGSTP